MDDEVGVWSGQVGLRASGKPWNGPPEAAEIARRQDDATKKCVELIAVSKSDEQACWLFLKRHGVERPGERKRRHYQWPKEAAEIAAKNSSAVSRCAELKRLNGYSERVCWGYLKRHGIDRPGAKAHGLIFRKHLRAVLRLCPELRPEGGFHPFQDEPEDDL